ncbi:MAG: hypothetical protein FJ215_00605 [Ignavibacteria bacterium]|nr:hypothetical protein [Ignavibacteria bacterium]
MPINYEDIRYRGDAEDVKELFEVYRVENYLNTYEERLRQDDSGLRQKLMKEGIKLTDRLSPRIHKIFRDVCSSLDIEATEEIYCLPGMEINAFASLDIQKSRTYSLVAVTAGALENLEDAEIKSVLGHEMGHFLFRNNRLNALLTRDEKNPAVTVLPPLGESLYLRWRKKAEISADRVGLLACGNFKASATSLMKCAFGLSEKNLNLDIDSLLHQIDEIKGHPELMEETFASHPVLPIRLKALELFSRSEKATRNGLKTQGQRLNDEELEDSVDDLIHLTRRYPYKTLHQSVMKAVALSGVLTLGADGDIGNEEAKILIQILHRWFTDEPEKEILSNRDQVLEELPKVIAEVNRDGDEHDKEFILSRLADIALADGALLDAEGGVIMRIAEMLNIPERNAYRIIIGAAQTVGFRTDIKLNRIADELRESMKIGFPRSPND